MCLRQQTYSKEDSELLFYLRMVLFPAVTHQKSNTSWKG